MLVGGQGALVLSPRGATGKDLLSAIGIFQKILVLSLRMEESKQNTWMG
jgi:hypothetical protein